MHAVDTRPYVLQFKGVYGNGIAGTEMEGCNLEGPTDSMKATSLHKSACARIDLQATVARKRRGEREGGVDVMAADMQRPTTEDARITAETAVQKQGLQTAGKRQAGAAAAIKHGTFEKRQQACRSGGGRGARGCADEVDCKVEEGDSKRHLFGAAPRWMTLLGGSLFTSNV
jgi:hypothetical protein